MLEWATPQILLLLALLPLLRRLHRRQERAAEIPVSALFLWPEAAESSTGPQARQRPDPRWRLRAAIAAALVTAAAGPGLARRESPRIDVHLDASPTLLTQEVEGTRLALAIRELRAALEGAEPAGLRVLSLGRTTPPIELDPSAPRSWQAALEEWVEPGPRPLRLPAAAELLSDRESWLVSDGTDPEVVAWSADVPLHRTFWVGSETENAGVIRLAVRGGLRDRDTLIGIVQLANAGLRASERRLKVTSDELEVADEALRIGSGEVIQRVFELPARHASVRAILAPGDALPEDDALDLATSRPLGVWLDPRCGRFVREAVEAHPGLRRAEKPDHALEIACSERPGPPTRTTVRLTPVAGSFYEGSGRAVPDGSPAGPLPIEVDLDVGSSDWATGPGPAARFALLLDRVSGRSLLERTGEVNRPRETLRIIGERPERPVHAPSAPRVARQAELSGIALVIAALLLVVDAQWARSRP